MSVTEHLMRPGSGSIRFRSDIPLSTTQAIFDLIDEDGGGVGAHIVLTPIRVDPDVVGDAAVLGAATYTGKITARPSRLSLEFEGLGVWLDTYIDSAVSRTSGTLAQWLGDLLTNDLSQGTVGTATAVTKSFPAYVSTRREILDSVMGLAGAEYVIQPDMTVDADDAATLFGSTPTVVVTRKAQGPDGVYRGVDGGMIDQAISVGQIATKVVALTEGNGSTIATGSATTSPNLNAPKGSAPDLCAVISAPGEQAANASTLASNFLNLQSSRRSVTVTSTTHHLPRYVQPGRYVYIYDPLTGLMDTANQIQFRGETISPAKVRLLSYTWPIESGLGVYIRSNDVTPTYIDVTDWVEFESGETWWTVGDWNPPSYGRTNRTNPEVEDRVSERGWTSFTPSWSGYTRGAGTTTGAEYLYVPGGMRVRGYETLGSTSAVTGALVLTIPNSETIRTGSTNRQPVGTATLDDISTRGYHATVAWNSSTSVQIWALSTSATVYPSFVAVSSTVPFTWTTSDRIIWDFMVPL